MVQTGQTWGFLGNSLREDLADFIVQIGFKGRPFMEITGDTTAHQVRHEWNERGLRSRGLNRETQGFNYSFADVTVPTRRANYTQIHEDSVFVARSNARSMHAGIPDLIADQMNTRLTEHLNDIEYGLLNGTLITGTSGASGQSGAQMDGLLNVLFSNSFSAFTTASLAISHINDAQDLLDSRGLTPTDILAGPTLKKRISAATSSNTKYVLASDKEIIDVNMVYEGDYGRSMIRSSRDLNPSGNGSFTTVTTNTANLLRNMAVIDRSLFSKAWLDKTFMETVPKREDGVGVEIITELSFEYGAATGGHFLQGL